MNTEKVSSAESAEPCRSRRGVPARAGGACIWRNESNASDSKPPGATSELPSSPQASKRQYLNYFYKSTYNVVVYIQTHYKSYCICYTINVKLNSPVALWTPVAESNFAENASKAS